jgi:hypothetical protein
MYGDAGTVVLLASLTDADVCGGAVASSAIAADIKPASTIRTKNLV